MHGKGIFTWPDGRRYEGNYKDDKKSGFGIYTWKKEGKKYEGEWQNGKQHGVGKMIFEDGTEKNGKWENGKLKSWE